jgi:hypothetical protein
LEQRAVLLQVMINTTANGAAADHADVELLHRSENIVQSAAAKQEKLGRDRREGKRARIAQCGQVLRGVMRVWTPKAGFCKLKAPGY